MRDDGLPELSAIEQFRPRGGEPLERAGKLRLREHAPGCGLVATAQVVAGELAAQRWITLDGGRMLVDFVDIELDQREAIAREHGRRRQRIAERLLAVRAHELGPAGEIARHAGRQRPARQILAFGEAIDRKALRHARHEIEHPDAPLGGDPAGREPRARQARTCTARRHSALLLLLLLHRRRCRLGQQPRARLCGERMRRRDDAFGG